MNSDQKKNTMVKLPYMILGLIAVCMVLTGCLYEPTTLSQNQVQVEEARFSETVAAGDVDEAALQSMARHYSKHGEGPFEVTVTYDPKSSRSAAMNASEEAARIAKDLRTRGVHEVASGIMPVKDQGSAMNVMVAYAAYYAHAPKDCTLMPGVDSYQSDAEEHYKLGCTRETLFARQIARPKDLKGQGMTNETSDGRRLANSTESYRDGVPNEPLGGESSTSQ